MTDVVMEGIKAAEAAKKALEKLDLGLKIRADGLRFCENVRQQFEEGKHPTELQLRALKNFRDAADKFKRKALTRPIDSSDTSFILAHRQAGLNYEQIASLLRKRGVTSKTGADITQPLVSQFMIAQGHRLIEPYKKAAGERVIEGPDREPSAVLKQYQSATFEDLLGGPTETTPTQLSLVVDAQSEFLTQLDEIRSAPIKPEWKEILIRDLCAKKID